MWENLTTLARLTRCMHNALTKAWPHTIVGQTSLTPTNHVRLMLPACVWRNLPSLPMLNSQFAHGDDVCYTTLIQAQLLIGF